MIESVDTYMWAHHGPQLWVALFLLKSKPSAAYSYPKQDQSIQSTIQQLQDKFQIINHKQLEDQSIMKIAAVLFILSVCYIASTEQAAAPAGVHTYPSWSWRKEMEYKAQQGMKDFKMNAEGMPQRAKIVMQAPDPVDPVPVPERPAYCNVDCCEW